MAVETTTSTQTTQIDPAIQPYLSYALQEAQNLYKANAAPNAITQQALDAMRTRALAGSPLVGAAQGQIAQTVGGEYLSGTPFFQGAFAPAAEAAQVAFQKGIGDISSAASKAGRYGVNAATQNLFGGNANTFAKALTGTAGQLAYQNYANERQRQLAAAGAAPSFAEQDYTDIGKLFSVGQTQQNFPQQALTNYLSAVYGQPMGKVSTAQTPYFTNPTATALGTGLLGLQFANQAAPYAKQAYNWLSGSGNSPSWTTGSDVMPESTFSGSGDASWMNEAWM